MIEFAGIGRTTQPKTSWRWTQPTKSNQSSSIICGNSECRRPKNVSSSPPPIALSRPRLKPEAEIPHGWYMLFISLFLGLGCAWTLMWWNFVPWTGLCWSPHRGEWTLVPYLALTTPHKIPKYFCYSISSAIHSIIRSKDTICATFCCITSLVMLTQKWFPTSFAHFLIPILFQFNFSFCYFTQKEQKSVSSNSCCSVNTWGQCEGMKTRGGCGGNV